MGVCTLTPNQRNTFPPCGGLARFQKWIAHITEFHGDYFAPLPVPSGLPAIDLLLTAWYQSCSSCQLAVALRNVHMWARAEIHDALAHMCTEKHISSHELTKHCDGTIGGKPPPTCGWFPPLYKVWYPYCTVRKLFQYNSMHVQDRVHGHMYLQATR